MQLHSHPPTTTPNSHASILAEVGSCQLEFAYLSHHTGDPVYAEKARAVFTRLDSIEKEKAGLYPVYISPASGEFTHQRRVSFGSLGDSFYEYLLKLYLLSGKQDVDSLRMFNEAMQGMKVKHECPPTTPHYEPEP